MKRFSLATFFLAALLVLISVRAAFADERYAVIDPPVPTETGKKIEVLEVFFYACPHCFDLEPLLVEWVKTLPKDVAFRRMPVVFRENTIPLAKAFYAFEALGVSDKLHSDLFNAIHVEGQDLSSDKALAAWVKKHGIDEKKFLAAYNSFAVQSKVNRAKQLTGLYGITGVPSLIINGKYRTSSAMAGGHAEVLKTASELIEKVRNERGKR